MGRVGTNTNAILIGSLRVGGAESAVRNIVSILSPGLKKRTCVLLMNDPNAMQHTCELGLPVYDLGASNTVEAVLKLRTFIRSYDVRCIHAHLTQSVIAAGFAVLGLKVRIVPFIHTYGSWKQKPRGVDWMKIALERTIVNRVADTTVYVSHRTKDMHGENLRYRLNNAVVIPNIVSRDVANSPASDGVLKFLSIGRIEKIKGFDWVIEMQDYDEIFKGSLWTIVGDGSYLSTLRARVAELGRANIQLVGMQKDVVPYLRESDIFFMPSLSEGLPMALLEACRAGMPLLASDVGSIGEVILHGMNGFLIGVSDEAGLASSVAKLRDSRIRRDFSKNSKAVFARLYDPATLIEQIEGLLI